MLILKLLWAIKNAKFAHVSNFPNLFEFFTTKNKLLIFKYVFWEVVSIWCSSEIVCYMKFYNNFILPNFKSEVWLLPSLPHNPALPFFNISFITVYLNCFWYIYHNFIIERKKWWFSNTVILTQISLTVFESIFSAF